MPCRKIIYRDYNLRCNSPKLCFLHPGIEVTYDPSLNSYVNKWMLPTCKLVVLVLIVWFMLFRRVQSDTALPISRSSLKTELFIACRCIHNHLTSIRFSSGDIVGRNTRYILGWYLARVSFTIFDLYIDVLYKTRKICFIVLPS
jgi:hypothetical protein